jgi:hypothetical protein
LIDPRASRVGARDRGHLSGLVVGLANREGRGAAPLGGVSRIRRYALSVTTCVGTLTSDHGALGLDRHRLKIVACRDIPAIDATKNAVE